MVLSALGSAEHLLESVEHWFALLLNYSVLVIEIIGMMIIIVGVVRAIIDVMDGKREEKINLAKTIGFALELITCGEILKTIIAHTWKELSILGIVVVIRAAITLLTHWELHNELNEHEQRLEEARKQVVVEEQKLQTVKATRRALKKEIEAENKK